MQNGTRRTTTRPAGKSASPFANRSKPWTTNVARPDSRNHQSSQRSYEHYLALARTQAQSGDTIGAESSYQHAEHFLKSMSSDPESK